VMSDKTKGIMENRRSLERVQISDGYNRTERIKDTYPTVSPQVGS
jgi:hypothetical protein